MRPSLILPCGTPSHLHASVRLDHLLFPISLSPYKRGIGTTLFQILTAMSGPSNEPIFDVPTPPVDTTLDKKRKARKRKQKKGKNKAADGRVDSSSDESTTAPVSHLTDSEGRTRGAKARLGAPADPDPAPPTASDTSGGVIPAQGASSLGAITGAASGTGGKCGESPVQSDPLPPATKGVLPILVFTRVPSNAPSLVSSGDVLPELRSVSNSSDSSTESEDRGMEDAIEPEEMKAHYGILADTAHCMRGMLGVTAVKKKGNVEFASATPSLYSLINPAPSTQVSTAPSFGILTGDSISQAFEHSRVSGRIFLLYGRDIDVYNEPISNSVARYHQDFDPLKDVDPLIDFGAVDGVLPRHPPNNPSTFATS
ncbi:hypothetical protein K438DRAFT_2011671 [Mycena galopus ATCC 62051]|nr:hypothetical protein K438DRAFT_2011671 [Mycena galopus ATCC 62051]